MNQDVAFRELLRQLVPLIERGERCEARQVASAAQDGSLLKYLKKLGPNDIDVSILDPAALSAMEEPIQRHCLDVFDGPARPQRERDRAGCRLHRRGSCAA
jgi:hypothetical protein